MYGIHELENNFFTNGILSYAYNTIKNSEYRLDRGNNRAIPVVRRLAQAKYHSKVLSTNLTVGYKHSINDVTTLIPSIGLAHQYSSDEGYTEHGAGTANRIVEERSYHQFSGNAGVALERLVEVNTNVIVPNIHVGINHNLDNQSIKVVSKLVGSERSLVQKFKPTRVSYNLGCGLLVDRKNLELNMNYDANLAKKYIGHQGSISARFKL